MRAPYQVLIFPYIKTADSIQYILTEVIMVIGKE